MPKKKKEKYTWAVGQPLPNLDEHSQTKHLIISDYIKRYVEVYMSNTSIEGLRISIVDGFAGGGKYNNILTNEIADGSPFIILNAIHDAERSINAGRTKPRHIDAQYYFIDCNQPHISFLRNEIEKSQFKNQLDQNIFVKTDTFARAAPDIVDIIKRRNRAQRSLFILDQYAYKDVPFNTVKYILDTLQGSEIILTFNFNSLQNYITDHQASRSALANIQLEPYLDWRRLNQLKEAGLWKTAIQEQLASAIHQASGARHITLFFISPKSGLTYWLVHLSKVYRARDVMMSLHWKHCNSSFSHHLPEGLFSLGYKATEIPGQANLDLVSDFDFGDAAERRCINKLAEDIPRFMYSLDGAVPFSELVDKIGSYTPAAEDQIRQAITRGMKYGEIRVRRPAGSLRRSAAQISAQDLISYCQKPLIFL